MGLKCNGIGNRIKTSLAGIFLLVATFTLPASAETTVSIGDFNTAPGDSANGLLTVNNVTDFFAASIDISYNPSVVIIGGIKQVDPSVAVTYNINNTAGSTRIIADGPLEGLSGDIALANISFVAVGTAGSSSALDLILNQMIDINGNDISATLVNGSFTITGAQIKNISGYKINDTNSNGIWDAGEQGIDGWRIALKNASTNEELANTTTYASGFYEFKNLAPDSYNITEETRAGWAATNATFQVVTLADQDIANLNFTNRLISSPYIVSYTISNRTIIPPQTTSIDLEFSEKVTYKIAIEKGNVIFDWTGTSKNPVPRKWNGTYKNWTRVPDGIYTVNITWRNTTTGLGGMNNTETVTVESVEKEPPAITGWGNNKTNDDTLDISVNESETVRFNATANQNITLWNWLLNDVDQSNNFDNFSYNFTLSGNYTVKVNAANDNGTSNTVRWNVTVNQTPQLNIPRTHNISGYKINDTNANGIWDEGEQGIANWNITLLNATSGEEISSTATNAAGLYEFKNLTPGSYNVTEEMRKGWRSTNATYRIITLDRDIIDLNFTNKLKESSSPPAIIGFTPLFSPVINSIRESRTFSININQTANVTWYINGTPVQTNTSVTRANYTNRSAKRGIWNVTAVASNINGTAVQRWNWDVRWMKPMLSVSASPMMVKVNKSVNITFKVTTMGKPVESAAVTLKGAGISASGLTNSTGYAVINVNATSKGQIKVIASRDGYSNAAGTVMVMQLP